MGESTASQVMMTKGEEGGRKKEICIKLGGGIREEKRDLLLLHVLVLNPPF